MLSVSHGENGDLVVALNDAKIIISELRIRPMSNFRTPHEVLGKGGASLALTDDLLVKLIADYLRFSLKESVNVESKQVGWHFKCESDGMK